MEYLRFAFENFWHYIGIFFYLVVIFGGVHRVIQTINVNR